MKDLLMLKIYANSNRVIITNPVKNVGTVGELVGFILNVIIGFGWALVFVFIALGLINYITSKGEKDKAKNARNTIIIAVIGGIALFILGSVRFIITSILGTNALSGVEDYIPNP